MDPQQGGFSEELAQYLLSIDFTPDEHTRYDELAAKSQEGTLTKDEEHEIDDFLTLNAFLSVLQSKARSSLKKHNSAA